MIASCQQNTEVAFYLGLEPEKCPCPMTDHNRKVDRFVSFHLVRWNLWSNSESALINFCHLHYLRADSRSSKRSCQTNTGHSYLLRQNPQLPHPFNRRRVELLLFYDLNLNLLLRPCQLYNHPHSRSTFTSPLQLNLHISTSAQPSHLHSSTTFAPLLQLNLRTSTTRTTNNNRSPSFAAFHLLRNND